MKTINKNAPVVCRKEIIIHANREKVWKILTSIDQWPNWNTDISQAKHNGNLQPGATFDWKTAGAKIHSTLHTVEPFSHLGWTGKAVGAYAIHNWTLIDIAGKTKVLVEESMEGFMVRLLKRMFSKNLEAGMQRWLDLLKRECEDELKAGN